MSTRAEGLRRLRAVFAIQSLTDATILSARYGVVAGFYEREAALLMDTAAVRYESFLREHASIEARVADQDQRAGGDAAGGAMSARP